MRLDPFEGKFSASVFLNAGGGFDSGGFICSNIFLYEVSLGRNL